MSNEVSSAVAVWAAWSEFVQVTSVPASTVTASGSYLKSAMSIVSVLSPADELAALVVVWLAVVDPSSSSPPQPATPAMAPGSNHVLRPG